MAGTKQAPKQSQLKKSFVNWMRDPDNNSVRLISRSKLKELVAAIDPDLRMSKDVHLALCKALGRALILAIPRVYDNKRSTMRASDI